MNYRHIYHAGNFTEVVKHSVLALIIEYLRQKSAGFCYIDTHAGEGIYDLTSLEAQKTGEAAAGVQRLIQQPQHPDSLRSYLQILKPYQLHQQLTQYPGSPVFAYQLLRSQDQMILNEYHSQICQQLKQNFAGKSRVAIHQRDAYEFLPAVVPPLIARGLVLIDPPFEQKDENEKIQLMLEKAVKKWMHGIYMIWYPITNLRSWRWQAVVSRLPVKDYLVAELTIAVNPLDTKGLLGCRLLIINPPWRLADALKPLLNYLWEIFTMDRRGGWSVQ